MCTERLIVLEVTVEQLLAVKQFADWVGWVDPGEDVTVRLNGSRCSN